jgi:hypothetical protein
MSEKRIFYIATGLALLIIGCISTLVVIPIGVNWYAELSAHEFCDRIRIGSRIASVTPAAG